MPIVEKPEHLRHQRRRLFSPDLLKRLVQQRITIHQSFIDGHESPKCSGPIRWIAQGADHVELTLNPAITPRGTPRSHDLVPLLDLALRGGLHPLPRASRQAKPIITRSTDNAHETHC